MSPRPRVVFFDILRGVAVVLVLGRHMAAPTADVSGVFKRAADLWIQIGWTGVDLFFVLSGFLVSGLLFSEYQRHGSVDVVRFLVRRGFKIYPGFYFMIVVTVSILVMGRAFDTATAAKLIAEVFYLQSYIPGLWNHTWSLAVEEHFYVLLAAAVYVAVARRTSDDERDPFGRFFRVSSFIVLAITAARTLTPYVSLYVSGGPMDPTHLRLETHARVDTLLVGVILSYLYHFQRTALIAIARRHRIVLTVVSVVLLIPPFLWPLDRSAVNPGIGLLSIALGFAGILLLGLAASPRAQSPPAIIRGLNASLAAIGFHSYSIYLWHMPIQVSTPMLVATFLPATAMPDVTFAVTTGVYLATAVLVGMWIGRLIEQPSLSVRDRFFPTRAGGLVDRSQPAHAAEEWTPVVSASR